MNTKLKPGDKITAYNYIKKESVKCTVIAKPFSENKGPLTMAVAYDNGECHYAVLYQDEWQTAEGGIDGYTVLTHEFSILDALAGSISDNYAKDIKRLTKYKQCCSPLHYDAACQLDAQP